MKKIQRKQAIEGVLRKSKYSRKQLVKEKEDKNRLQFENYIKMLVCVKKIDLILNIKNI
jgi:hypothetical protein